MAEPLYLQIALEKFNAPTDRVSAVLEAGCGSTSHISFNFERKIDGIDIEQE